MLDTQDLQAIAELMDRKLRESETRMDEKLRESESRMRKEIHQVKSELQEEIHQVKSEMEERIHQAESRMKVLIEADVMPKINLIAEAITGNADKTEREYVKKQDFEKLRDRLDVVEVVVKQHSRELKERKLA